MILEEAPGSNGNTPLWGVQEASSSRPIRLVSSSPDLTARETLVTVDESGRTVHFKISPGCSFRVLRVYVLFKDVGEKVLYLGILIFPDALKIGQIGDEGKKLGSTFDFN